MKPEMFDFSPKFTFMLGNHRIMYGKDEGHPRLGRTLMTINICERGSFVTHVGGIQRISHLLASLYSEAYVRELPRMIQIVTEEDMDRVYASIEKYASIGEPFPVLCSYNDLVSSKVPFPNNDESEKDVC